ncbi:hypothetical protein BST61_g9623 [Cercospora zeina]
MAGKVPLPFGEQMAVLTTAGGAPASAMGSGDQQSMAPVPNAEQAHGAFTESAEAPPNQPAMSAGQQDPLSQAMGAQHLQSAITDDAPSSWAPVAVMVEPNPVIRADPDCSTPTVVDQAQAIASIVTPTPVLNQNAQISNAFASLGPMAPPEDDSMGSLFVPQGTKHLRSDSVDFDSASKRVKSEAPSSQASVTSEFCHQAFDIQAKAEPITDDVKPKVLTNTSTSNTIPCLPTNTPYENLTSQLLSTANAVEPTPQVRVNPEVPAPDPLWPRNKPHHPGFHPNIPETEKEIRGLVNKVAEKYEELNEQGYHDEIVKVYVDRLRKYLQQVSSAKEVEIVALLGVMGIGKSEAYEALVGQEGIAIKSDSGRGTHFPIEGHGRKPAQKAKIEVVAIWKTRNEFKNMVTNGCGDVFTYLDGDKSEQADGDTDDESDPDDNNTGPSSTLSDRLHGCDVAMRRLLPLLQEDGHHGFHNAEAFKAWLVAQKRPNGSIDRIVDALLDRIINLRKKRGIDECTNSYEADSAEKATAILRRFSPATAKELTDDVRWEESCHIKKATLHLNNDMGAEGIVFADVPGRNDPDEALNEMTAEYIKSAKRYLVMTAAGRPITHESDQYLRDAIRSRKPTIFVVTKIDDKDDLTSTERDGLSGIELKEYTSAESRLQQVQDDLDAAEAEEMVLEAEGQDSKAAAACKQTRRLRKIELPAAQLKVHQLKVQARNKQEEREIRAHYQKLTRGKDGTSTFEIVFISAKEYGKHLRNKPSTLEYEVTGVPRLFRKLYRSVAGKKLDKLLRLCHTDLPRQLIAIKHVLTKTPIERYEEFRSAITATVDLFEMMAAPAATKELESWTTTHVSEKLKKGKLHLSSGQVLLRSWNAIRSPTFHALCKRYGDWKGRRLSCEVQYQISGVENQSGAALYFDDLLDAIRAASDSGGSSIANGMSSTGPVDMADLLFNTLEAKLDGLNFRDIPRHKTFLGQAFVIKLDFRSQLVELFEDLFVQVMDIRSRAIDGGAAQEKDNSYVGQSLRKTYIAAMAIDKKTIPAGFEEEVVRADGKKKKMKVSQAALAHRQRIALFQDKLTNGKRNNVFKEVRQMIDTDLAKARDEFVKEFRLRCDLVCTELLRAFSGFYTIEGTEINEEDSASAGRLQEVVERVLNELPPDAAAVADAKSNGIPPPEKGTIEKLLEECLSWKAMYPDEQED